MVQKEPLRNNLFFFFLFTIFYISCSTNELKDKSKNLVSDYTIDTVKIPNLKVEINNQLLSLQNGKYFYNNKLFSGYILEYYPNAKLYKKFSVLDGLLHGTYLSFYADGTKWEHRTYKNGLSTGKHCTYWPSTGRPQTEYNYYEERMEGTQRKWYKSGAKYLELNYVNDREEGLQRGWRENGKIFLNYEVKNGFRYGLQKAALCYTLRNEKLN